MFVKETSVTSAFEDDANRVALIHAIARTFPDHLETVYKDTGLCGLIWLTRNCLSLTPKTLHLSR